MFCIKSYSYRHVFSLLFYFKLCWILVRKPMVSPHTEFPSVATIQAKPCTNARTTDAQWSLFSLKSRIFGLGQTNWADKFWGISGIFGQTISTHFGTVSETLVHVFHHSTIISTKNKLLYPHPKYVIGFGIGIWIWAAKN